MGDVRDYGSVDGAMRGVDYVFQHQLASRCLLVIFPIKLQKQMCLARKT
jgi:hypothetical protein